MLACAIDPIFRGPVQIGRMSSPGTLQDLPLQIARHASSTGVVNTLWLRVRAGLYHVLCLIACRAQSVIQYPVIKLYL